MRRTMRVLGLLLAVCLLLSTAAFAAETETKTYVIQELDVSLTVPETMRLLDKAGIREMLEDDYMAALLTVLTGGIDQDMLNEALDHLYLVLELQEDPTVVEGALTGGVVAIEEEALEEEPLEESMPSLEDLSEEELEELIAVLAESLDEVETYLKEETDGAVTMKISVSAYRNEQSVFLMFPVEVTADGQKVDGVFYVTIQDNNSYIFFFMTVNASFAKTHQETVEGIMDSVRFQQSTYSPSGFVDVKGHWAEDSITKAKKLGLFAGTSEDKFSPDLGMTRAMLVQVLHRMEGKPEAEASQFTDVAANAWYANAVAWAAENAIVEGSNGKFRPDDLVTRQELAAVLYRYCGEEVEAAEDALGGFSDAASVAQWALAPVGWAVNRGLLNGSNGKLMPAQTATRAQVAAILVRYLEAE